MCLRRRAVSLISNSLRPLLRVGRAHHRLEQLGVEHERLEVVAHRIDVDVLVDELDGLRAERVPHELAGAARRLHRDVDLRQPAVVGLEPQEHRVGRDGLPELPEHGVLGGECVAHVVVRQALLRRHQALVAGLRAVDAREEREALLHRARRAWSLSPSMFADHAAEALLVELERLRHVVEHAEVVDDETVRLLVAVGAVRAADGLEQRVVAQRLVEVHRLEDGRVEAGQQLGRDDEELQRIVRIAEAIEELLLLVARAGVGLEALVVTR